MDKLEINQDFKNLIPKLTQKEYEGLERSIIEEGCRRGWGKRRQEVKVR